MNLPPSFSRPFRLIVFDWDGTAVDSRRDDATPVRGPIVRLLRSGVLVAVITGTNLRNIDGQLARSIRGSHKRNLYLATNRGSEVYGFDEHSRPVAVWRREATAEEEWLLTEVAVRFVDALLRPKVVLEAGSDIEKAKALHEKAHDICVIVNSVNFPVRHEAEVRFTNEKATPT